MRTLPKFNRILVAVSAALICLPGLLLAQGNGSITGTVSDSTGAVIPGAAVTATQASTGLAVYHDLRRGQVLLHSQPWRPRSTTSPPNTLASRRIARKGFNCVQTPLSRLTSC